MEQSWPNLVTMFFDQVERLGEAPFLWAKRSGAWRAVTWREAAAGVSEIARGLRSLGVEPGDRVVLVSENRPEWLIADFGIMAAGAVTVPAYTTNTVDDHLHIISNSGARVGIVSTRRLAERFLAAAHKAPEMTLVITLEQPQIAQHLNVEVISWTEVLERGRQQHWNVVAEAGRWQRRDLACIIHTSGTGGAPKGVMQHHGAILHNCSGAEEVLRGIGLADAVFLSFLPLSHSYEHTAGQFLPVSVGSQIYYAEGLETLAANMQEVRPTFMTAVPRLYETLHARITRDVTRAGGFKAKLFDTTLALGRRRHLEGGLGPLAALADVLLDRLVRDKVRGRFGGRLKALISGGAPLNPDIGLFFTGLGLTILQGYGQTEAAPVVSVNRPGEAKLHTVGPILPETEVRIAADGEILVRGELVMPGYWRNEAATREAIRDGWLHTGDIGEFDADGHLLITDRKKDIIVNSGGDNLSPQRIEGLLALEPEIAQAMVFGDRRPHLVGLLVPDPEWMQGFAAAHRKPAHGLAGLRDDAEFRKALGQVVERVNARLSNIEKVRRFAIAREPFSIENGQMTPTLKIRRHVITKAYGTVLEELYG